MFFKSRAGLVTLFFGSFGVWFWLVDALIAPNSKFFMAASLICGIISLLSVVIFELRRSDESQEGDASQCAVKR